MMFTYKISISILKITLVEDANPTQIYKHIQMSEKHSINMTSCTSKCMCD